MNKMLGVLMLGALAAGACTPHKNEVKATSAHMATDSYLPKAVVYKAPESCADLVPVTLDKSGTEIVSYPAPSDLSEASMPYSLGDGWYLDRRGISPTSAFTSYTYKEYMALPEAPSVKVLMDKIAVPHPFEGMFRLPVTQSEAVANPSICLRYIRNGFEGCQPLILQLQHK